MHKYSAKKYICFASDDSAPHDRAYSGIESPIVIVQDSMLVTDELVEHLLNDLNDVADESKDEMFLTVDTNSLNREFLLLLSTLLFRSMKRIRVRFLYFSAGKPEVDQSDVAKPYTVELYENINHERAEVLPVAPGIPVFDKTTLVLVSGYEVNGAKRLVDRFRPHEMILGRNKKGTSEKAHNMNLKTHKAISELMEAYTSLPFDKEKNQFVCCVRNPIECCKDIDWAIRNHDCTPDTHIKLAATNTKLSIVGAALYAAQKRNIDRNIQLVYTNPIDFDENKFSKGANEYYEYIFDPSHLEIEFQGGCC